MMMEEQLWLPEIAYWLEFYLRDAVP